MDVSSFWFRELALFITSSGLLSGSIFSFAVGEGLYHAIWSYLLSFWNAKMCLCISWFWKQWSNIIIRIYILTMIETVSCPLFLHSYGRQGCDGLKIAKVRLTFSSFNAMPAAEIIKKKWLLLPYEIDLKLQYLGDIKPKRTIKYTNIYFISWYLWTMRRQNPNLVPLKTFTLLNQPSFHKHMRNFFPIL